MYSEVFHLNFYCALASSPVISQIAEKLAGMQQSLVCLLLLTSDTFYIYTSTCFSPALYSHVLGKRIMMLVIAMALFFYCQNVLHDVPDYEERKKLLESLKNRLEALLSPRLVAAFNSHNLGV